MLKQVLCILLILSMGSQVLAEAFAIEDIGLLDYDSHTGKLSPRKSLTDGICSPGAQSVNTEGVNALMNGVHTFISDIQSPSREFETHPHSGVFASFQRLKAEIANTNSSVGKLRGLIDQLGVQIQNANSNGLSPYHVAALTAEHGSLQTLQLIESRRVYVFHPGDINVLKFADVMQSDKIDFIVRARNIKNTSRAHYPLVDELNDKTQITRYRQPHQSTVISVLREAQTDLNIFKSIARVFSSEVSPQQLQNYLYNENVIQQLTRWTHNPKAAICGTSLTAASSLTDQCITSDIDFVMELKDLATYVNRMAFTIRDREVGYAVRNFVGIDGARCGIQGSFHLLKLSDKTITLYTEGDVFVKSSEPNQQKTPFDEFDILTALDVGEPNFKIEQNR